MSFTTQFIHTDALTEKEKCYILDIAEETGLSVAKTMILYLGGQLEKKESTNNE